MNGCTRESEDEDVQITKVVPRKPKKPISWVASSFDSFSANFQREQETPFSKSLKSSLKHTSSDHDTVSRKRPREANQRHQLQQAFFETKSSAKAAQSSDLWSERYRPSSKSELAIHKKKVEEITEWFTKSLTQYEKACGSAPVLLLTGPPGAGKTACVRVICRELGWNIQEWSGTSDQAADQWISAGARTDHSQVDVYQSQSQSAVFHNFLLRANKYQALDLTVQDEVDQKTESLFGSKQAPNKRTVILVEEMPNIFYRDSAQFHDVLRKYKRCGKSPLVFIMSDSNNNSSGTQKLFPKDLMYQLHIDSICMNPVAPTLLVKLLTRVTNAESRKKLPKPSSSVIETIAVSSGGDIRSALNSLQFACRKDTMDLGAMCTPLQKPSLKKHGSSSSSGARLKYSSTKRRSEGEENQGEDLSSALGLKDKAIFLFQTVGKVLHFKRGNPMEHHHIPSLPDHLKQFDRDPLLFDPEEVAFKSQLSGDYLTSFLHENYVEFLSSVEDLEIAAEYFSDADSLSALWTAREELQSYSVSIAMRGYIHSNSDVTRYDSTRKNHGRLPLHKSRWLSASKQAHENVMSARQLFKGNHWEPEVLCTEILPYISLTNPTLHDPGQISFVQEMTTFSRSAQLSRTHLERLNEKDELVDEEEENTQEENSTRKDNAELEEDTSVLGSQSQIQPFQSNENDSDEEIVIEDFDDESDDFEDLGFS